MSHAAVHTKAGISGLDLDDSTQLSMLHSQLHQSLETSVTDQLSNGQPSPEDAYETQRVNLSRSSAVILITTLSGITFVGSMSGGLLTVGLPTIAKDLNLPNNLLLW